MKAKKKKKLSLSRPVYMEDLEAVTFAVYETLNKRDIWFNSVTSDDDFHRSLIEFLEQRFNYPNYNNHN
jgi:hypothetical protein